MIGKKNKKKSADDQEVSKSRYWVEPFVGVSLVLCLAGLLIAFVGLLLHSVYFSAEDISELKAVLDVPLPDKVEGVVGYRLDQIEKRIDGAISIYGLVGAFFSTFITVLIIYFSMTSRSAIDKEFEVAKRIITGQIEDDFQSKLAEISKKQVELQLEEISDKVGYCLKDIKRLDAKITNNSVNEGHSDPQGPVDENSNAGKRIFDQPGMQPNNISD